MGPGGGEDEDHSDEEDNGRQRKKGEVREGGAPEHVVKYSPSGARWLLSGNNRTEGKLEKGRQSGDTEALGPGVTLEEDGHSLRQQNDEWKRSKAKKHEQFEVTEQRERKEPGGEKPHQANTPPLHLQAGGAKPHRAATPSNPAAAPPPPESRRAAQIRTAPPCAPPNAAC
ncbi:unnamed protein product [Gadus morhua 'NCC']